MKDFEVYYGKKVVFKGTNEDYVYLCNYEKENNYSEFETSGDIEEDFFDNNFFFGDSGDYELVEA